MRDDMFEVIIERPRHAHWAGHYRRARRMDAKVDVRRDPDAMLAKIGMKRSAKFGRVRKDLNENLAPLRRYLEKQVNRPWDKVWSEISEHLSANSTVQQHVRDHVGDFVAVVSFIKDGAVWVTTHYGKPQLLSESLRKLYVDPRTGILRRNKHYESWSQHHRKIKAEAAKHRATRMREIGTNVQAHKLDDNCWWEVRLAPILVKTITLPGVRGGAPFHYNQPDHFADVVRSAKLSALPIAQLYGRDGVYAASKRQLSKHEIDNLGLPR